MPKLLVRSALADLHKPQTQKPRDYLARLEYWNRAHLSDLDRLRSNKLRLYLRLAILQQHADDLAQILVQLIERVTLTMRAWKSGDIPDK